jgi:DNA-binding transcriptional regulator GbsR (MarR family)
MPKGDRLILKADPEDGTTPIANLLLEAVAMAKISGLQKGALLYLWRKTYGWIGKDGKRLKEAKISLSEWSRALDSASTRLSHALGELEQKGIIKRRTVDNWGGYYYSINTDIKKWNSNSINLDKLSELISINNPATIDKNATVTTNDNSCDNNNSYQKQNGTVDQNATQQLTKTQYPSLLYKEILNKDKERGMGETKNGNDKKDVTKNNQQPQNGKYTRGKYGRFVKQN